MMIEDKKFIADTLQSAIEWADYADEYFKVKHDLAVDRENVAKSIALLQASEAPKVCSGCRFLRNGYCIKWQRTIYKTAANEFMSETLSCTKHEPKV